MDVSKAMSTPFVMTAMVPSPRWNISLREGDWPRSPWGVYISSCAYGRRFRSSSNREYREMDSMI